MDHKVEWSTFHLPKLCFPPWLLLLFLASSQSFRKKPSRQRLCRNKRMFAWKALRAQEISDNLHKGALSPEQFIFHRIILSISHKLYQIQWALTINMIRSTFKLLHHFHEPRAEVEWLLKAYWWQKSRLSKIVVYEFLPGEVWNWHLTKRWATICVTKTKNINTDFANNSHPWVSPNLSKYF